MQKMHRGRLLDHLQLVVNDLDASHRFYEAMLKPLGIEVEEFEDGTFYADEFVVSSRDSDSAQGRLTGPSHFAFQAKDRAMVDAVYRAGLEAGGRDNGAPGERKQYHPGYYAAFLLDPDGNNVEVVFHGEAQRSADSVEITFKA